MRAGVIEGFGTDPKAHDIPASLAGAGESLVDVSNAPLMVTVGLVH